MIFDGNEYKTLIVSSSEKFDFIMKPLLSDNHCSPVTFVKNIAAAKRAVLENSFDFIIVNSPLTDEFGIKFVIDSSQSQRAICLFIVKSELHEEVHEKVLRYGIFTLSKPTSPSVLSQSLKWMAVTRERIRLPESKVLSIEEKMEEIRIINRAKWLLIDSLKMSEPDAHRYIEKQAMDKCVTKREIAEGILKTYNIDTNKQ